MAAIVTGSAGFDMTSIDLDVATTVLSETSSEAVLQLATGQLVQIVGSALNFPAGTGTITGFSLLASDSSLQIQVTGLAMPVSQFESFDDTADFLAATLSGDDTVTGGSGNDVLQGYGGNNSLNGGGGSNTLDYSESPAGVTINLATGTAANGFGGTDTFTNFQAFDGSSFNDTFIAGSGSHVLNGGGGVNTLDYSQAPAGVTIDPSTGIAANGFGGTDTFTNFQIIEGSDDGNTAVGSSGVNTLDYSGATAGVTINLAADTASNGLGGTVSFANFHAFDGSSFDDTFIGGPGNHTIDGGGGSDTLDYSQATGPISVDLASGLASNGFGGTDVLSNIKIVKGSTHGGSLTGGSGDDTFVIEGGDNTITGGSGTTEADYANAPAGVAVDLATGLAANGFGGTDTLRNVSAVTGSPFDDTFTVDAGDFTVDGGGGNDTLDYFGPASPVAVTIVNSIGYGPYSITDSLGGSYTNMLTDNIVGGTGSINTLVLSATTGYTLDLSNDTVSTPGDEGTGIASFSNFEVFDGNAYTTILGGPGNHTIVGGDRLDYAAAASPITVNLQTGIITNGFGGTDLISGINVITGGSGNNLYIGGGTTAHEARTLNGGIGGINTFDLSGESTSALVLLDPGGSGTANVGNQVEVDEFSDMEIVKGTPYDDTFAIDGYFGGTVIGGGGVDTASFVGPLSDFVIARDGANNGVVAGGPLETGTTTLSEIHWLNFFDVTVAMDDAAAATDFSGGGTSDILWRNATTGDDVVFLMNGGTVSSAVNLGVISTTWMVAGLGDISGTGTAGILWRDTTDGNTVLFNMSGGTVASSAVIGTIGTAWTVAGIGDFDGSESSDILWRNTVTGDNVVFVMNGNSVAATADLGIVGSAWKVAGIGDFNGDGISDILWRNTVTGDTVIFDMSGGSVASSVDLGGVGIAWTVAGVGDFTGNGISDILWRNTVTGDTVLFLMNGNSVASATDLGGVGTAWSVAEIGDFNGDGKADILWRNATTGADVEFLMNGAAVASVVNIGGVGTSWSVQKPALASS